MSYLAHNVTEDVGVDDVGGDDDDVPDPGPQYAIILKLLAPLPQVVSVYTVFAGFEAAFVTKGTAEVTLLLVAPLKLIVTSQEVFPMHDSPTDSGKYA